MKVFCFSYAGGTADFFNILADKVKAGIYINAIDYSGHGKRFKEPLCSDFKELSLDMYNIIKNHIWEDNYALFGYSMGAIVVTEVLKLILNDGDNPIPKHIFLAAHEPHTKSELRGYTEQEADEFIKERTVRFGGVPEQLIKNDVFWRTYLPIYRADFSMIGKYRFENLNFRCDIPTTIFYSETDTPYHEMINWKNIYVGDCVFIEYIGNHFFIKNHYSDMANVISKRLR